MIESFLQRYRDALGDAAPLPVVFGYGDEPVAEIRKIPRCMIGAIRRVCEEGALTLCADNVLCGGGSLYTAFAPMQERIPGFVSEVEHYKQTPGQVREYAIYLRYAPQFEQTYFLLRFCQNKSHPNFLSHTYLFQIVWRLPLM